MRKVGARILLCLMLVIALVTSTLTAFAEPNTTETPVDDKTVLDLSGFKSDDLKNYGGVASDGCVYLKSGYSYLFLFEKDGKYYIESWETLVQVEDVNKYVTTESNYRSDYPVASDKYYYIDSLESMKKNVFADNHFYILALTGKEYINVGKFNDVTELKNGNVVEKDAIYNPNTSEISKNTKFDVTKTQTTNSATITVSYKADGVGTPFTSISIIDSNGCDIDSVNLSGDSALEGTKSFTVNLNSTYEVRLHASASNFLSKKITVEGINEKGLSTPTVANIDKSSAYYKKPTITFKDKPKSAPEGNAVTIVMKSDIPAIMNFNGKSSKKYVKSMKVKVYSNTTYNYTALGQLGKKTEGELKVNFFKSPKAFDDMDRDSFWNSDNSFVSTVASNLPQTGSVGWYTLIVIGVALVGGGAFAVFKVRKKKTAK